MRQAPRVCRDVQDRTELRGLLRVDDSRWLMANATHRGGSQGVADSGRLLGKSKRVHPILI